MYLGSWEARLRAGAEAKELELRCGLVRQTHGHGQIDQFFRFNLLIKSFNIIDAKKNVLEISPKINKSMKK
jgi:hypothetical protein